MSVQRATIYSPRGTIGIRLGFPVYAAAREFVEASLGALMGGVLTGTKRVRPLFMRGLELRSLLTDNFAIAG